MAAGDATGRLVAYLSSDEGTELVVGVIADIGGDPEEFGIAQLARVGPRKFGDALRQGLEQAADSGELSTEIAELVTSTEIDWREVAGQVDAVLWRSFVRDHAPDAARVAQIEANLGKLAKARADDLKRPHHRVRRALIGQLRAVARTVAPKWQGTSSGLVYRAPDGYGQIVLRDFWTDRGGLIHLRMTAGSASKYLLRVVSRQRSDRVPTANFTAAHAATLHEYEIRYALDPQPAPRPFVLQPGVTMVTREATEVLSRETAAPWLAGLLEQLAPAVERTSTDAGLLDWLLARVTRSSRPHVPAMREAVVLARHLGLPYDDLLARADTLAREAAALLAASGEARPYRDRQTTYPEEWSHQRFVQFLESLPT